MKLLLSIIICLFAVFTYNSTTIQRFLSRGLRGLNTTILSTPTTAPIISNTSLTRNMSAINFVGLPVIPPNDPSLTKATADLVPRRIQKAFLAVEQAEGAGARVRRSIGTPRLRNFTPFLMLDHFNVAPGAGFPDHPHRGQETITYCLTGNIDHEDFTGNKGTLEPGDLQFMTAGRGIVHAEMPRPAKEGEHTIGMQLWVDLPKELKECEPRYRDLKGSEIPIATSDDGKVSVKVISGASLGVESLKELAYTPVWLLDFTMKPGGKIDQPVPAGWNTFAYSIKGSVKFGAGADATLIEQYHNTVFEQKGDSVVAEVPADATEDARFILTSGMSHDQPIFQYGPFVCSSQEEVYKALRDYQTYSNGFERARDWESEIGKPLMAR